MMVNLTPFGEQHVFEDLGRIPSFADWAWTIRPEAWMGHPQKLDLFTDTLEGQ